MTGVPLPAGAPRGWLRHAALGDSLSEGLGDPRPGGRTGGWATQLADRLRQDEPSLAHVNLAVRGHLARDVLATQLEPALAFEPDLVSVLVGGNDVLLRPAFRPERLAAELDRLVAPFAARGATVVMSTLPDLTACSPVPHPVRGVLRRRLVAANTVVQQVARAHGTVLLDAWADPRTRRHAMWSVDRIHPSADGHRLIAASVATLLGLDVTADEHAPAPSTPVGVARRYAREAAWLLRHGAAVPQR